MDKQNEKYLIELKTIKQSLESFVKAKTKHTKEGQEKTIHTLYGAHLDAQTSKKISHKMFSLLLKKEAPADKLEPALNCFMTFFYFTPFIADYIREQFPSHFVLRFRTEYPSKLHQLSVKVL